VPAGKHYHGCPAEETSTNYCTVEPKVCSPLRRFLYSAWVLGFPFISLPILWAIIYFFWPNIFERGSLLPLLDSGRTLFLKYFTIGNLFFLSVAFFFLSIAMRFVAVLMIPRLFSLFLEEGKTYVLYGVHYFIYRIIFRVSNSGFFNTFFGDSSFIVFYLNAIGFKASKGVQTGSNFGTGQKHDVPFLCKTGHGTMVSDGLAMLNAEISNCSFKLAQATIGDENYLGNQIVYPWNAKTGKNCLLGTKALIPIEGPVRENTGLLGAPCFEIPRMVERDKSFDSYKEPTLRKKLVRKKDRHNIYTIAFWLFQKWGVLFLSLMASYATIYYYGPYGVIAPICLLLFYPPIVLIYYLFYERVANGFTWMKPRMCSVLTKDFWTVEFYWKLSPPELIPLFKGTPFKCLISKLCGVKMGKKVFDDGFHYTEKCLVEVGDYCNLNDAAACQAHSLEEGVFKSGYTKIGKGCTIGTNAYLHYDVTVGDNVILDADSFLMKGENVKSNSIWGGNPAREM